jgi:hypothetical protein
MYVDICRNPKRQECDSKRSREDFEIQGPYNRNAVYVDVKTRVIPVIIGATGTIS